MTLAMGCFGSLVPGDVRSCKFSFLVVVVRNFPPREIGVNNCMWHLGVCLCFGSSSFFYPLTLRWSIRNFPYPLFYVVVCSIPQTHVRYSKMEPSGLMQNSWRDPRGWYGSTIPVSSTWYNGGPWWRTMLCQASDNCSLPAVHIFVGISGMTEIQVRIVPLWYWWYAPPNHRFQFSTLSSPHPSLGPLLQNLWPFTSYWCYGTKKMAWPVGDVSGSMIVYAYREGVVIYCKFLRLTADVGARIWR